LKRQRKARGREAGGGRDCVCLRKGVFLKCPKGKSGRTEKKRILFIRAIRRNEKNLGPARSKNSKRETIPGGGGIGEIFPGGENRGNPRKKRGER